MQNCWSARRTHRIMWQKRNGVLKGKSRTSLRKMAAGEETGSRSGSELTEEFMI